MHEETKVQPAKDRPSLKATEENLVRRLSDKRLSSLGFHELNKQWLEQNKPTAMTEAALAKKENQLAASENKEEKKG